MKALALALSLSFSTQTDKPIPQGHPCYLPEELMVGEENMLLAMGWYNCFIEYDKLAVQHVSVVSQKDMWKEMALVEKPIEEKFSLFGMPEWATAGVFILTLAAGIGIGAAL